MQAFAAVHAANMAKFQSSKARALAGAAKAMERSKVKEAYTKLHKGNYIVYGFVHGYKRILKPAGWQSPDLTEFIF